MLADIKRPIVRPRRKFPVVSEIKPLVVNRRVAAGVIGSGTTKLDELIATGKIEARKSGKNLLVVVASLEAYVASLPKAKLAPPRRLHVRDDMAKTKSPSVRRRPESEAAEAEFTDENPTEV
jgi:hypothetical protein